MQAVRARARREGYTEAAQLRQALRDALLEVLKPIAVPLEVDAHKPFVIMLAGVNGAARRPPSASSPTTTRAAARSILLAAGDTFRAAAREQLIAWGERNNVTVIAQQSGDAAAVIFDAISAAQARGIDIVLADTAGRLPTQLHLMEEIRKVKRVIAKALPGAPHEVLLVLDANTGQNALAQVKAFDEALGVTGLVLTKLDGTAKGGVIAAIAHMRSQSARDARYRCASSASAKDSTTCARSTPRSSSRAAGMRRRDEAGCGNTGLRDSRMHVLASSLPTPAPSP